MSDVSPLVIVGAGGLGSGVAALIESVNSQSPTWNLVGFIDDNASLQDTQVMGYPVCGDVDWLTRQKNLFFVIAIGDGPTRKTLAERLEPAAPHPATLIHPSASPHRTATIEPGAILRKGIATAVNFRLGSYTVLNFNCTIGHDSTLDAFVTLHPGVHVSGNAHLKSGVTMGAGSVVLPDTTVGANTTVGAGAVVTDDLPADCTAVGVPARPLS